MPSLLHAEKFVSVRVEHGFVAVRRNKAPVVTINGADLETASAGDGVKIVKVFVKNAAGTWSVA